VRTLLPKAGQAVAKKT